MSGAAYGLNVVGLTHDGRTAAVTKLDLVRYYLTVADGALRGAGGRPMALKRYPNGAAGPFFFQKRAPESRPVDRVREPIPDHRVEAPRERTPEPRPERRPEERRPDPPKAAERESRPPRPEPAREKAREEKPREEKRN